MLAGPRFVDRAPAEVVATLLDEGHYLCSERTMYRILAADQPVRERRNQREHPQYSKPELVATAPNQTWSWDITKLLGPTKWTYFYLYVVLDIFSRYAVGWMVADRENSALAGRLIEETCHKQGVQPQVLTLHSDRGAPMTSKCTAQLLADLGVTRSLSRPQVSDDNPFSEAQFKTLKYHPGFPGRFHDITAAIAFCRTFFPWYNTEHRHGGIAMLTPDDVHRRIESARGRASRTLRSRDPTTGWIHDTHNRRKASLSPLRCRFRPGFPCRHHRRDRPNASPTTPNIAHGGIGSSQSNPERSAGGKPPGPVIASFEGSHNRIPFPKPSGSTHL